MMLRRVTGVALAALAGAAVFAAPAQADSTNGVDNFLNAIDGLGITAINPQDAVEAGKALCPLLADRGQNTADIAGKVSDAIGKPLGASTMFTGAAISFLCPRAVENISSDLSKGKLPLPLFGN